MSIKSIVACAALLAGRAIASPGKAVIVNKCEYDVFLFNVPAADGGFSEIDKVLSFDDTYEQTWTELTNGNGWSMKLSKSTDLSNILQYEYTFHNDGTIWYDLSAVNGNPWDGDWMIAASSPSSTCAPKQQAYRYATDDAYGMQACADDAVITVTLCSGEDQADGGAASVSSSVEAAQSTTVVSVAEATSTQAPSSTTPASSPASTTEEPSSSLVQTTFATATSASTTAVTTTAANGNTVTSVATAVVTDVVTATYWETRRHQHNTKRHAHPHARV